MKSFTIITCLMALITLSACNNKEEGTVKKTTEEVTKTDTIGPKVRKVTAVEETTETDSGKVTITSGGVFVENIKDEEANQD